MPEVMTQVVNAIDQEVELRQAAEFPFRHHLGGSLIGRPCLRELQYSFRWAKKPKHAGRLLRLFERGHLEEFRFVKYLKMAGFEIQAYSQRLMYHPDTDHYVTLDWRDVTTPPTEPEIEASFEDVTDDAAHVQRAEVFGVKLKQWRISDVKGHFGGSLDGKAKLERPGSIFGIPEGWGLLEFKTHNEKSFKKLQSDGVQKAKPEHWNQQQTYMHKEHLLWSLYLAVNKNTDELYAELVPYNEAAACELIEKAWVVIEARKLLPRVKGANHPSWHQCAWCDYKQQCHYGELLDRNCRTCQFSVPVENGEWFCERWSSIIPSDAILKACDNWKQITD